MRGTASLRARLETRSRQGGFSLLELIIVIALIAILSALAGPSITAWIWKARLTEATRNVERKLNTVRQISMANHIRHCVVFTQDPNFAGGGPDFQIGIVVSAETATGSQVYVPVVEPPELAGWVNDATTDRFKGVSLAGGNTTDIITGTQGCTGLLYNVQGYLDNPVGDFPSDCDGTANNGASCNKMTLRQKALDEVRTLWVDRAGGVRVSQGPTVEPAPPT
jgi:prepilin-type N-terminal cleavage/methylation domain-containing protein